MSDRAPVEMVTCPSCGRLHPAGADGAPSPHFRTRIVGGISSSGRLHPVPVPCPGDAKP